MAKEHPRHLRQMIAQRAARLMVEDGVHDFSYAKKKAGRQLGISEYAGLPSNAEIEAEISVYHGLYHTDTQPAELTQLRKSALMTMQIFARFQPYLTGSVLEGTAGRQAQTEIHLFADSAKEVELFLLNQHIPFVSGEKNYRASDKAGKDKKDRVPVFTLETEYGLVQLSVFDAGVLRLTTKTERADIGAVQALLDTAAGASGLA